jgi:adenylate cyclase
MSEDNKYGEMWRLMLQEGVSPKPKELKDFFSFLPGGERCKLCKVPFQQIGGAVMRLLGTKPSNINPRMCDECEDFIKTHPGGAEIRMSMLFADIRGSTSLAEQMNPTRFRALIDRFYSAATDVLVKGNALIDKLAGDQVSGYFVQGMTGPEFSRVAIETAQELLRASGYGSPEGPWIPVGVGVHTGEAFMGAVGSVGGISDFTALGDSVNIAARLASNAGPGEILVSQDAYDEANPGQDGLVVRRSLELKGRVQPVSVVVLHG